MSTTIDQKVVEMRFDNANFENNVKTSMSTLEKLKRALKFDGASKGLENIQSTASKMNFSGMTKGIETVNAKFSYMQATIQHQLNNIVDSAVNAGKRMVSALTIDPVKSGLQEYETQINSVQTILANTQKEGTTVKDVNAALDQLNTYADKTIYNFTEMTRNIGTFTAAGVKLDTSVKAIQGIANLAAVSGSTSQQASTAMYQLSQALAAGKVQLMDWNSVVNAGMGGQVFQDALIRTSELLGTGAKQAIETAGSFRESLTKSGWLTTEVLTETLNQLSGAYSKADLMAQGYSEEQADEIVKLAKTAEDAATKVKTFTQLWDVMKEAAQSGWAQTWRLIIGDFEEAKALFTPLADFFTNAIGKMSDARNKLLESAFAKNFSKIGDNLTNLLEPAQKAAKAVADLGEIVDKVIGGKFGNGQERFDKLAKAGYNYCEVQNKVNEKLGCSYRYSKDQIEAQDKLLGSNKKLTKSTSENGEETDKLTKEQKKLILQMAKLSDEELRAKGYTEDQIQAFHELRAAADKLGMPLDEFIDKIDEINGRWILIDSFKNIGKAILKVAGAIGSAWRAIFEPMKADTLFNAIAGFHKFTESLILSDQNVAKLKLTFKGLFAILDIISTITGGALKIGFKVLSKILGAFDMNILDLTAGIGDAIVKFRDWLFQNNAVVKSIDALINKIPSAIAKLKELWGSFKEIPVVKNIISYFEKLQKLFSKLFTFKIGSKEFNNVASQIVESLVSGIKSIPETMVEIGKNIIEGLENGLGIGISEIPGKIAEVAHSIIETFCEILGIHSPSLVAFQWGVDIIRGLVNGLIAAIKYVAQAITTVAKFVSEKFSDLFAKLEDVLSKIDWPTVFEKIGEGIKKIIPYIPVAAALLLVKKVVDFVNVLEEGIGGINEVVENFALIEKNFAKTLKAYAFDTKMEGLKKFAIAVGILVGSIVVLSLLDKDKMYDALGVVVTLAIVLVGLSLAMDKLSSASVSIDAKSKSINMDGIKSGLIAIGGALLLMAITAKIMGSLDPEQIKQGFIGLTGIIIEMGVLIAAIGFVGKKGDLKNINKVGGMMLKLSITMALMVGVIKLASGLSAKEVFAGIVFATAFAIFVRSIASVAKSAGNNVSKVGGLMIKLAIAMGLMVLVVKMAGMLNAGEMIKGAIFAAAFVLFVKTLVRVTRIGKKEQIAKIGGLLISMSVSLLLMVGVCKLVGMLSVGELVKGAIFMLAFIGFVKLLVKATEIGNEAKIAKVAGTILAVSIAIGVLAGVSILLGMVELANLVKGVSAVTVLGLLMAAMIKATKGANNVMKNLIVMTLAIGIMAAAIAILSRIDGSKLMGASLALSMVMGMFALIVKASGTISGSLLPLITMVAVVGLLAGILYALSKLEVQASISNAASLSILLLSLSASMLIISKAGTFAPGALLSMAALTLVLAGIALILGLMSHFNVEASITTAVAMSTLLIALSASALILSKIGMMAPGAELAAAKMVLIVAGVGLILTAIAGLIGSIPGAEEFLNRGIPVLEAIGNGLGKFIGGFIGGIGEGITDSLPKISENIKQFVNNFSGIDSSALDGAKATVGVIAAIGGASIIDSISRFLSFGEDPMEKFSKNALSLARCIKQLSDELSGSTIDEASIQAVANAGMLFSKLQNTLPKTGGLWQDIAGEQDLAEFGRKCAAFASSMTLCSRAIIAGGGVDEAAVEAAAKAGTLMSKLQNTLPKTGGIWQEIAGEQDLTEFGRKCAAFGHSITLFSKAIVAGGGIDEGAVESAAKAGTLMSKLQNTLPKTGGIWQEIAGEQDISDFGRKCAAFASSMTLCSRAIVAGGGIDEGAVEAAAKAGTMLRKLQSVLPKTGGWWQEITGEQDISDFGKKAKTFGAAMASFSSSIGDGISEAAVASVSNAGTMMAALQDAIPTDKWFDGKVSLDDFGGKIKKFGESLVTYSNTVSEFKMDVVSNSILAANRLAVFTRSITDLDTAGLWMFDDISVLASAMSDYSDQVKDMKTDVVSNSISIASRLKSFIISLIGMDPSGIENFKVGSIGSTLKSYANSVKDIKVEVVSKSITVAARLKNFVASLTGLDSSGVSNFKLGSIGSSIKAYSNSVAGIDVSAISSSIAAANKLKSFISSLKNLDTSGVSSFRSAVTSLGKTDMGSVASSLSKSTAQFSSIGSSMSESITRGFRSKSAGLSSVATMSVTSMLNAINSKKALFQSSGMELMSRLVIGASSQIGRVTSMAGTAASSGAAAARGYYWSFYSSGSYLASGFVSGIRDNIQSAANAAASMAAAASAAARRNLKINSPSKVFKKIGSSVPEGFALGIGMFGSMVKNAVNNMSDNAIRNTSKAISRVYDLLNSDMDTQPTIRPVLDLADIESGVGAINGMFGNTLSLGATANVGAISSMMAQRNQNGDNTEIVDAINRLSRKLDNAGQTINNINGVTYDDGSNISDAVSAIVRAARVERRR